MKKVFIVGGTTYDHVVYLKQLPQAIPHTIHQANFSEGIGSTGAGKALALTKLGINNTLYSVVGNDVYGNQIKQYLQTENIHSIIDFDDVGTERHINLMDTIGGRVSIFVTQSSEQIEYNTSAIKNALVQCDIVVLNIIGYCRNLIPLIQQYNKPIWTDLHDYDGCNTYHQDFINASEYIHLSSDNLPNYKQTMQQLILAGKKLVICTHGKNGATLLTQDGVWYEQAALQNMPIVDTNGAGDSFFAGFLYGFINNLPLITCLQYGAIAGGYCVTNKGLVFEQLSAAFLKQQVEFLNKQ